MSLEITRPRCERAGTGLAQRLWLIRPLCRWGQVVKPPAASVRASAPPAKAGPALGESVRQSLHHLLASRWRQVSDTLAPCPAPPRALRLALIAINSICGSKSRRPRYRPSALASGSRAPRPVGPGPGGDERAAPSHEGSRGRVGPPRGQAPRRAQEGVLRASDVCGGVGVPGGRAALGAGQGVRGFRPVASECGGGCAGAGGRRRSVDPRRGSE